VDETGGQMAVFGTNWALRPFTRSEMQALFYLEQARASPISSRMSQIFADWIGTDIPPLGCKAIRNGLGAGL